MIKWLKNILNEKKRRDLQFQQKVIFIASIPENIFNSLNSSPKQILNFDVKTELNNDILNIYLNVNNEITCFSIKSNTESIIYMYNFLQSVKIKDDCYYVSDTDNPTTLIMTDKIEGDDYRLFLFTAENAEKTFDIKISKELFMEKFISKLSCYFQIKK